VRSSPVKEIKVYKSQRPTDYIERRPIDYIERRPIDYIERRPIDHIERRPIDHIERRPFKESSIVELVSDKKDTTESNEMADKNNRVLSKGNNVNQVDDDKKNFEAQDSSKFQVEYIDTIETVKGQIVYKTSVSSSQESEKKLKKHTVTNLRQLQRKNLKIWTTTDYVKTINFLLIEKGAIIKTALTTI